jgi:DNA-binding CsgD family transcriptional regulator
VRALIRLTNEAAELRKAGSSTRGFVLEGLCKIIEAPVAMTFDFKVLSETRVLMNNGYDVGFSSQSDRAYIYAWFMNSGGVGDPTFPGMLSVGKDIVTRRREDLVGDAEWRNAPVSVDLHRKVHFDDVLLSLRFCASGASTGLVFKRESGRKRFTEEQRNLIDLFSVEYGSLIIEGRECQDPRMGAVLTLSPRERDVLALLAKGLSYVEIANVLEIRHGTVQSYVKSLYGKLNIGTKAEAAAIAVKAMLI